MELRHGILYDAGLPFLLADNAACVSCKYGRANDLPICYVHSPKKIPILPHIIESILCSGSRNNSDRMIHTFCSKEGEKELEKIPHLSVPGLVIASQKGAGDGITFIFYLIVTFLGRANNLDGIIVLLNNLES